MELDEIVLNDTIHIDLHEKLGQGSFGVVRRGSVRDMTDSVAVKLELEPDSTKGQLLRTEAQILKELQGAKGVPTFYFYGVHRDYHFLVMQLLGPSLNDKLRAHRRPFSLSTVLQLLDQLLISVESLHRAGYIYRDFKPHNCLLGLGRHKQELYLIDFGLAKKVSLGYTSGTIMVKGYVGTLPFISLNGHLGVKAAKRDDIESIAYVGMYLLMGKLPWYCHGAETNERETRIGKQNIRSIWQDLSLPQELLDLILHARSLRFDEDPDYIAIREQLRALGNRHNVAYTGIYDWDADNKAGLEVRKHRERLQSSPGLRVEPVYVPRSGSVASYDEAPTSNSSAKRNQSLRRSSSSRKKTRKRTLVMKFCGFQHREEIASRLETLKEKLEPRTEAPKDSCCIA
jgi:serine/threonine protein kinase